MALPERVTATWVQAPVPTLAVLAAREVLIRSKTGQLIPVRFSGSLLREGERLMGSVAFFQDLREIKRLESEKLENERLAAVGQTVAQLAHGIKNILNGLQGGATQFHDLSAMFQNPAYAFQVSKCGLVVLDVIECAGSSVHHQGIGTFLAHWICWVISVTRAFSHIRI